MKNLLKSEILIVAAAVPVIMMTCSRHPAVLGLSAYWLTNTSG